MRIILYWGCLSWCGCGKELFGDNGCGLIGIIGRKVDLTSHYFSLVRCLPVYLTNTIEQISILGFAGFAWLSLPDPAGICLFLAH